MIQSNVEIIENVFNKVRFIVNSNIKADDDYFLYTPYK